MRHYIPFQQTTAPGPWWTGPVTPSEVQRERVSGFIDVLDCLLAVWIAEAILESADDGWGRGELSGCREVGVPCAPSLKGVVSVSLHAS